MSSVQTSVDCVVKVNQRQIKYSITSVELEQAVDRHHALKVKIVQKERSADAGMFGNLKDHTGYLGKPISLSVQSSGGVIDAAEALEFE